MKTAFTALVVGLCLAASASGQTTSPPVSPMNQGPAPQDPANNPATMPSNAPTQDGSLNHANPTIADLTGQVIYNRKGKKIGTVSAMTTDPQGQQAASVRMEKYLGMDGRTVVIPVSSLEARQRGGYTAKLSSAELTSLAKSGAMSNP